MIAVVIARVSAFRIVGTKNLCLCICVFRTKNTAVAMLQFKLVLCIVPLVSVGSGGAS